MKKMNSKNILVRTAAALLLAVSATMAWAQSNTVYIPSEELVTYGSSSHPSYMYYSYSLTQQIYTAAEIGRAGKITSISFYNRNAGAPREYDIYLTLTDKGSFNSKYDWTAVKASEKVFSGTVTLAKGQWTVIDFDTPFDYNGTQNLILTVDDNTDNEGGQYGNNLWCNAFSASDQSLAINNNSVTSVNFDPMNPPTEDIVVEVEGEEETLKPGVYYRKNQIALGFETYPKPYQFTVADVTNESALINWTARGGESAWNVRYKLFTATDWTEVNGITTRSHTLEGLIAGTKYEVQVQSVVGENVSDWTASASFTTLSCEASQTTELIYAFMDRDGNGWGDQAVRVKEKSGLEVAYLKMPKGKLSGGYVTLCCGKEYVLEWVKDADDTYGYSECAFAFYYANGDELISKTYDDYNELSESHTIITFTADCTDYDFKMPTNLTAYDETWQGVTLSWKSNDATKWQLSYSTDPNFNPDEGTLADVDTNPFELTGLSVNTTYYWVVRAVDEEEAAARDMGKAPMKAKKWKKKSRWSKKSQFTTQKEKARARKLKKAKILNRNKAKAELNKYVGTEKKDNLWYSQLSTKRTAVNMDEVVVRQLEENKGNISKDEYGITSENHQGGSFDNVALIPAKKGSQLVAKVKQMKTGHGKKEPYETGWIPKKKLNGGDPANKEEVSDETMKNLLEINRRYTIKAYDTSDEEADALEANDDTEGAVSEARSLVPDEEAEDGYLFIRQNETTGGILWVTDIEIVEPEDVEPWTVVPLGEGVMEHVIDGLVPETSYLAKVEPVYSDETTGLHSPITVFTPRDAIYLFDDEDNSTTLAENDGKTDNVVMSGRTFYMDRRWNTFCPPFDMSATQIADSPLSEMVIMAMHDAELEDDGMLKVTFWEVKNLKAGKAYIFQYPYWDDDITNPYFTSVTIKAKEPTPYTDQNNLITFCGTYSPFQLTAGDQTQLYLKSDLLWYPAADIFVNAFRGYFNLLATSVRGFKLVFEDGETTDINEIHDSTNHELRFDGTYDLQGRRVQRPTLKPGLYIRNGKKVIVR